MSKLKQKSAQLDYNNNEGKKICINIFCIDYNLTEMSSNQFNDEISPKLKASFPIWSLSTKRFKPCTFYNIIIPIFQKKGWTTTYLYQWIKLMRILMSFITYILISGQHYKHRRFKLETKLSCTNNQSDIQWKGAQEQN